MKRNYLEIIKTMIDKKLSIREMASLLGMKKSTLHNRLQETKKLLSPQDYDNFVALLNSNKNNMAHKGGIERAKKIKEKQIENRSDQVVSIK